MPWSPLILSTRSNVHFTSADVNGDPSENFTFRRSVQDQVALVPFGEHLVARTGSGFAPCGKPYRPWKIRLSRVKVPKSYSFAGSMFVTLSVVPSTSVVACAWPLLAHAEVATMATAARPTTARTAAARQLKRLRDMYLLRW